MQGGNEDGTRNTASAAARSKIERAALSRERSGGNPMLKKILGALTEVENINATVAALHRRLDTDNTATQFAHAEHIAVEVLRRLSVNQARILDILIDLRRLVI